ncbi:MAG: hypothetical protein LAT67_05600 [Balneolales bacterium]|nr:hypothetical protein [Balneolales bacterium]
MSLIFLFIDGIGAGEEVPENPFFSYSFESIEMLTGCENGNFTSKTHPINKAAQLSVLVDANLGMDGLPQSGTGQASLFTGQNGAGLVGRHFGPFPHSKLKPALKSSTFFHEARQNEKKALFLNAYPPVFFERTQKTGRWSCSTLMVKSSGFPLSSTRDVLDERAVTAEIFGDFWRDKLNIILPKRSGKDIAEIIMEQARIHDLLFWEYYLTDKAGHAQKKDFAFDVWKRLDSVLVHLIPSLGEHTLLICSDHGNYEDLSTKSHTRNKVPLWVMGPLAENFAESKSITDVGNLIKMHLH